LERSLQNEPKYFRTFAHDRDGLSVENHCRKLEGLF